nr:TspO/MBR family protein [Rhodococcus wratislaviensis]GLK34494.1 hypothetical protein GCM10017611_13420 [Rhodococcus wratislaviensis]
MFPVVWSLLYTDLAVVSAVTLDRFSGYGDHAAARNYRRALATNLAINATWSWVFFRAHRLGAAPVVAAVLLGQQHRSGPPHRRGRPHRGNRSGPYPLWCVFATVLSASIWHRNRSR